LAAIESQQVTPQPEFEPTQGFSRAMSRLLDIEPEQEFRREFWSTVAPTLVFLGLLTGYFLLAMKGKIVNTAVAYSLIGIAAILSLALAVARRPVNDRWVFLQHSVGSLTGGLLVAAIVMGLGNYGLKLRMASGLALQNLEAAKIEATERDLADVAFSTVGTSQKDLQFETRRSLLKLDSPTSITIGSNPSNGVITLEARRKDLSNQITALISEYNAMVYSNNSADPQYRVLRGKISDVSSSSIEITPNDPDAMRKSVLLRFETRGFMSLGPETSASLKDIQGLRGLDVKVLYSPKTNFAVKMVPTVKPESSTIFYNAALSDLKAAAALN
jgi:energy-coupling factor transporter transmembrane protein EcfT